MNFVNRYKFQLFPMNDKSQWGNQITSKLRDRQCSCSNREEENKPIVGAKITKYVLAAGRAQAEVWPQW